MRTRTGANCAFILTIALGLTMLATHAASAQTYKTLYSFCPKPGCKDGADPQAGLIMDAQGTLYGTTVYGGAGCGGQGCGTAFKVAGDKETVLHRFKGAPDGANPSGSLLLDSKGNLYGVTSQGGRGGGTLFKIDPNGTETVLYSFGSNGNKDGAVPKGKLITDSAGNFYGTTFEGGTHGSGTVFEVHPSGTEIVLYNFCSKGSSHCTDGEEPNGGLVRDVNGSLYGTTVVDLGRNGKGGGAVFKLTKEGKESVLHLFCSAKNCADGEAPNGGLIMDAAGNLYGTTLVGGANTCLAGGQNYGCGTIFKVAPDGTETVLYNFCSLSNCADGSAPEAGLYKDAHGKLYGTASNGGSGNCSGGFFPGCGTVFELSGKRQKILHSFSGAAPDGAFPQSALIVDSKGSVYGTASEGGKSGNGVVFAIIP
jgi:uncharacterized repeat protein (TIGR03803 family)